MYEPWWKATPQELHQVSDRISSLYVEKCHIDRDENAIVLINKERTVRVPAAMIAVVMIGPGTRITHAAVTLLADSGTALCWVGEHGVRMYASGLGVARGSSLLLRQAWLVSRTKERLAVARQMYAMRFPGEDVSKLTMQQLRGREGARVKKLYRQHSQRTKVAWNSRQYKTGDAHALGDDVNRLLSAANSCLYGLSHAAVIGVGASPALGFVHTGSYRSFVLDVADLYKAEYTIPLAFDLAAQGVTSEREVRLKFRDLVTDGKLIRRIITDVKYLLHAETLDTDPDEDTKALWDEDLGSVAGGLNWEDRDLSDESLGSVDFTAVIGPDIESVPKDGN